MNTFLEATTSAIRRRRLLAVPAAIGALLFSGTAAVAAPAATAYNEVQSFFESPERGDDRQSFDIVSSLAVANGAGYAQSTVDATLDSLTAKATSTPANGDTRAVAESNLTLYFSPLRATGPVPVRINYSMEAYAAYDSDAGAFIDFGTSTGPNNHVTTDNDHIGVGVGNPSEEAVDINHFDVTLQPGTTYYILMSIATVANSSYDYCGCQVGGIGQAGIDPLITIDPAYLAAHPGVSLDISPGVGNVDPASPVPEPADWAMWLVGIPLLARIRAAAGRRR